MAAWYKVLPDTTVYIQSITWSATNGTTVTTVENHPYLLNQLVTFARIKNSNLTGPRFVITSVASKTFNISRQGGGSILPTDIGIVDPTKSYASPVITELSAIVPELQQVLAEILSDQVMVVVDQSDTVYVPLAQPPAGSKRDLLDYLNQYHQSGSGHDYHDDLGVALLFGCGK